MALVNGNSTLGADARWDIVSVVDDVNEVAQQVDLAIRNGWMAIYGAFQVAVITETEDGMDVDKIHYIQPMARGHAAPKAREFQKEDKRR